MLQAEKHHNLTITKKNIDALGSGSLCRSNQPVHHLVIHHALTRLFRVNVVLPTVQAVHELSELKLGVPEKDLESREAFSRIMPEIADVS
jgi:hypothetical protein